EPGPELSTDGSHALRDGRAVRDVLRSGHSRSAFAGGLRRGGPERWRGTKPVPPPGGSAAESLGGHCRSFESRGERRATAGVLRGPARLTVLPGAVQSFRNPCASATSEFAPAPAGAVRLPAAGTSAPVLVGTAAERPGARPSGTRSHRGSSPVDPG